MKSIKDQIKEIIRNAMHNGYITKEMDEEFENNQIVNNLIEDETRHIIKIIVKQLPCLSKKIFY